MAKLHRNNLFLSPLSSLPSPFGEGSGVRPGSGVRLSFLTAIIVGILAMSAIGIAVSHHTYRRNLATLLDLQAQNQADTIFRSDSIQQYLVRFFDRHAYTPHGLLHPGPTANNRLLAHYLLGRAHADMGDAPAAIEDYKEAVTCADTTRSDCDYSTLRGVYGQMAELLDKQQLPTEEILANQHYIDLSRKLNDTIQYLIGMENMLRPYYLLNDTSMILKLTDYVSTAFLQYGRKDKAARTLIPASYINIVHGRTNRAGHQISLIRNEADIFECDGTIKRGCEAFYVIEGMWYDAVGQSDSAIASFRKALSVHEYEGAYRGLLSVYSKLGLSDSMAKYSVLFAEANDLSHEMMNSELVIRTMRMYDYGHQQRIARKSKENADRQKNLVFILAVLTTALIFAFIIFNRKNQQRRKELRELSGAYLNLIGAHDSATKEMAMYKERNDEFIRSQQEKIDTLESQIRDFEASYAILRSEELRAVYYESAIVDKIREESKCSGTTISENDLNLLLDLFRQCFPKFVSYVEQSTEITIQEWRVIMLTDLCVNPTIMANMLKVSTSRITGLKTQVNKVLFKTDGAQTMPQNLKKVLSQL